MPIRMSDFESMSFDDALSALGMANNTRTSTTTTLMDGPMRMTIMGPVDMMDIGFPMQILSLISGLSAMNGLSIMDSDHLQTQLLQQSEPQWTPASKKDIQNLPLVTLEPRHIQKVENKNCSVCQEDFNVGEQVNQLPCYHFFHSECIQPWLEKNRTCPLCRKEVVDIQPKPTPTKTTYGNYQTPVSHHIPSTRYSTPSYPQHEYITRHPYESHPTNERGPIYHRQYYQPGSYDVHPRDYNQNDRTNHYYSTPVQYPHRQQSSNYVTSTNNNIYGNAYNPQPPQSYNRTYYQQPRYNSDQSSNVYSWS